MAKAVPSDGKNQELFELFLTEFDEMSVDDRNKAITWFSQPKENGRERLDDVKLPQLVAGMYKFYEASNWRECPAILKKCTLIALQQGKSSWMKGLQPEKKSGKFPWEE